MTNYNVTTVDEYIEAAQENARPHLEAVRKAIKSIAPNVEENIKWGKPYYTQHGPIVGFDAFKNHVSFEIWADEFRPENRELIEGRGYKAAKRTFQMPYNLEVPVDIIQKLVQQLVEMDELEDKLHVDTTL